MPNRRDRKRLQSRRQEDRRKLDADRARHRQTEQLLAQMVDYIAAIQKVAADPDVAAADFAHQLVSAFRSEQFGEALGIPALAWASAAEIGQRVEPSRALGLASAVAALVPDEAGAAWWASSFYYYGADVVTAERMASEAVQEKEDREALNLVGHLRREKGDLVGAVELAYRRVEADALDEDAQRQLGRSLILIAARRADAPAGGDPCGCSSGRPWDECCRPAEDAALARFEDGSRIRSLSERLDPFVASHEELARWQEQCVREWISRLGAFDHLVPEGDSTASVMAKECSAIRGPEWADQEQRSMVGDDGSSILSRFAADPATDPDLAGLARDWQARAACGLWQVEYADTEPGLWVTEIITRQSFFVAVPRHLRAGIRRWSVLAGVLIPDRGVWRAASALAVLDPDEGDLAAEVAQATVANVVRGLAVERRVRASRNLPTREPQLDDPLPWGVLAGVSEPLDAAESRLTNTVLAVALPVILSEVHRNRARLPAHSGFGTTVATWLDQPHPELAGETPRQAIDDSRGAANLERMLRRWEHAADGPGSAAVDTEAIRVALADEDGEPFGL